MNSIPIIPDKSKPYIKVSNDIDVVKKAERTISFKFLQENLRIDFEEMKRRRKSIRLMIDCPLNLSVENKHFVVPTSDKTNQPSFMPFSEKHFDDHFTRNNDGKFMFWKLQDVMDDNISSHSKLIERATTSREYMDGFHVPVYYLGIAYIGSDQFFAIEHLQHRFPVRSKEESTETREKLRNYEERCFLASFLDLIDETFPTEESSVCIAEGIDDEENSPSHNAFLHYANDDCGRGHMLKSISDSYLVGIYCDQKFNEDFQSAYGFVSGCI